MASDYEAKANAAFIDDRFALAVDLYSLAVEFEPTRAELYADRAQAHIKLANFTEAVVDANKAIELEPSMAKAYLRKGIACIKLEEYQTAKKALEEGTPFASGDSRFTNLVKECDERIADENVDLPELMESATEVSSSPGLKVTNETVKAEIAASPVNGPSNQFTMVTAKPKYRHEFYQRPEEVVVTIFAKGVSACHVAIEFGEQIVRLFSFISTKDELYLSSSSTSFHLQSSEILSVAIDVPDEGSYRFQPRLFGKILPSKCRYDVLRTKVEIRLAKADSIQWRSLEFCQQNSIGQKIHASSGSERPTYPSSKPKRVDWDRLEAQVKKEEKEEKLDGDAAVNKLFRQIYADADEDARRAMSKSFCESNGTVLSTDWKDVGSKKIEGSPPDGMEMRKWEY